MLLLSILINCQLLLETFFNVLNGKKDQYSQHIETSQLISWVRQLTEFGIIDILVLNGLNSSNAAFLLGGNRNVKNVKNWYENYSVIIKGIFWDTFCDLLPFAQFKKREKHSWKSVTFSTKRQSFMDVFTMFKLYNWYQIGQSITFKRARWQNLQRLQRESLISGKILRKWL